MEKHVPWVEFPGSSARLKIVALPPGQRGAARYAMLIDPGTTPPDGLSEAAEALGFARLKSGGLRFFPRGRQRLPRVADLAGQLPQAVEVQIPQVEFRTPERFIDLRKRDELKRPAARAEPRESGPDPKKLEELGLNHHGQLVVRDDEGRFYRVTKEGDSPPVYAEETLEEPGAVFLRLREEGDVPGLAGGLLQEIEKTENRHLRVEDIDGRARLALEPGGPSEVPPPDMTAEDLASRLAADLHRRIVLGIAPDGDPRSRRTQLQAGLRKAEQVARAIATRVPAEEASLVASPVVSVLLRHAMGDAVQLEVTGSERLARALGGAEGAGEREAPDAQVMDLSGAGGDEVVGRVMGGMARRAEKGSTAIIIAGKPEDRAAETLREEVGKFYGIEAVSEIAPGMASGDPEGRSLTLFMFGERRPQEVEFLPEAAQRTYRAEGLDGLEALAIEIQRSRGRLREWHEGIEAEAEGDGLEDTESYVGYRPMSKVSEPFSMVPRTLEAALSRAHGRVVAHFAEEGGVDNGVAAALGLTREELGKRLSAEQVDAVGMALAAQENGRGFLVADSTGIGKGRTLQALARAHMRRGGRVLALTESPDINVPDVFRDLGAVGLPGDKRAAVMAASGTFEWPNVDEAGVEQREEMQSYTPTRRRQMFEAAWRNVDGEGVWPEGVDFLATTYSTLSSKITFDGAAPIDSPEIREAAKAPNSRARRNGGTGRGKSARRIISTSRRKWCGRSA